MMPAEPIGELVVFVLERTGSAMAIGAEGLKIVRDRSDVNKMNAVILGAMGS